jgi:hypothetical protein
MGGFSSGCGVNTESAIHFPNVKIANNDSSVDGRIEADTEDIRRSEQGDAL